MDLCISISISIKGSAVADSNWYACSNIGAEREQKVLDSIEASFHPYVRDRGLDWEIHIEQVGLSVFQNLKAKFCGVLGSDRCGRCDKDNFNLMAWRLVCHTACLLMAVACCSMRVVSKTASGPELYKLHMSDHGHKASAFGATQTCAWPRDWQNVLLLLKPGKA